MDAADVERQFTKPAMRFYEQLAKDEQQKLCKQLQSFDPGHCVAALRDALLKQESGGDQREKFGPIEEGRCRSMASMSQEERTCIYNLGLDAIAAGQVAVVLLSGGQGTRLGSSAPKGAYDLGLPSGKSLFQLQAERILKLQRLASVGRNRSVPSIPWCVMVSEPTELATKAFFKRHSYFGLSESQVMFFAQDMMPCFGLDGRVLLDAPGHVAVAPNGNGGLYESLQNCEVLDRLMKYGIRYVHVYCVDNVLVRVADPWFIGFCEVMKADCAVKAVERHDPLEPIGVVCERNGLPTVVEYSEINEELSKKRDPSTGKLLFRAGNIANHMFTLQFLQRLAEENCQLPYHLALKKIAHIGEDGNMVTPGAPNGYKLERFVFDVFPFAKNFAVLEVVREEEFSPLKNADSAKVDCPTSCRNDLYRLHRKWVEAAGGRFDGTDDDSVVVCEVSPLLSYAGEGIELESEVPLKSPTLLRAQEECN